MLEIILNNPGLQHIAENILCNLKYDDLEVCKSVNESWKKVLDEPMFWLKIFIRRGLSMKDQLDWSKAIQLTKRTSLENNVLSYLKNSSKNQRVVNLPCYIDEKIVSNSKKLIKKYHKPFNNPNSRKIFDAGCDGDAGIIQILAPLMQNRDKPNKYGYTPIHGAVELNIEPIVQILAPLAANANARARNGMIPIIWAARNGFTGMIRILAPLVEDVTYEDGWTAMHVAAYHGKTEIIKFLATLTENFNTQSEDGDFPIDIARRNGRHEVVKFLESYEPPCKRARLH